MVRLGHPVWPTQCITSDFLDHVCRESLCWHLFLRLTRFTKRSYGRRLVIFVLHETQSIFASSLSIDSPVDLRFSSNSGRRIDHWRLNREHCLPDSAKVCGNPLQHQRRPNFCWTFLRLYLCTKLPALFRLFCFLRLRLPYYVSRHFPDITWAFRIWHSKKPGNATVAAWSKRWHVIV